MITNQRQAQGLVSRVKAFTLIELLVAMSIGLIIMNVAFTALYFTRKFVRKGEVIGAKNDAMQSMMIWCMTNVDPTTYPTGPQFRQVGGRLTANNITDAARAGKIFKAEALQYYNSQKEAPTGATVTLDATVGKYYSVVGILYVAKP
jgi:prepilin-type N-terminal cleavage/methylation domain-containing protein